MIKLTRKHSNPRKLKDEIRGSVGALGHLN